MSHLEDVADCLPPVVLEMVDLVGFEVTEKIIRHFGGVCFLFSDGAIYFPRLKALIGLENATILRQYFKSEEVYIPRCEVALRTLRNIRLVNDFLIKTQVEGKSGRAAMLELCPKYALSDRQAWEIVRNAQRHSPLATQSSLF
ncbi:Mor transcription activator family protein [Avibacterium paragallinarum]|uniref:Mor transcription activator family protein n=1 Tax=Avibacterium paragallinarum TaxID=728 RepID=A0ABU7QLI1_AVIPA|nr:Mor transcription activator family protein [Avibacterium paragallinarum]QZP15568.1 mor transcription activator family protein [Avibacterium paragallinarum]QZP16159.1 mor transcription activator family protein [Avibacterium paragallinarum]WAL56771.1 mor transcription activator family protein [Avibacterium paragallinarum]WAM59308.1 mor transcription activator family protein [Avibacterium paragallinarum]